MTKIKIPLIVLVSFMCGVIATAVSQESGENAPKPIRIEPMKTAYADMATDFPPWPAENIISGESVHRYKTFYANDIVVEIYEAKPMALRLENFPIDEFVTVVSGKLILTPEGGEPEHYEVGDSVLVPKGFTGIWEMQGNFREMIVFKNEQE